jgi:hypothetical protein
MPSHAVIGLVFFCLGLVVFVPLILRAIYVGSPTFSKVVSFIFGIAAVGIAATSYQTSGINWVGQFCAISPCWRPEWLMAGAAVRVLTYVMWPKGR